MERDEVDKTRYVGTSDDIDSRCAVNALILDYYKKFGRKRDLEQYFSLSTAQSDIKDTSGLFWRKMKSENDSSDSGDRKSDSSHEVCRISIRCSLPEPSSSQDDDPKSKTESPHTESPPIIIEEIPADVSRQTDEESVNFDDNNSQKSLDAILDLSAHKPLSPTSSITSQRKLEWDSLADVGYANESDRKNSASSLSTLERLALKQQYSNNDSKHDIGPPTLQSTPLDDNEAKSKKKGLGKKTTKIYKKDIEFVEVNVPDTNQAPSINVNLTKHISFNVEKDGAITVDNIKRDVSVSPEKVHVEAAVTPYIGMDKEIQTSLQKDKSSKEKSSGMDETPKTINPYNQKIPVMISLNTLRKRLRRKKIRDVRRKLRTKKNVKADKEVTPQLTPQEKSGEQLSEAESFEYMPGHMYNQNQIKENETRPDNSTGNKSSLESSGPLTTDSSKGSKHSLTKDLEKCVELLKVTLQKRYDDSTIKQKLIKDIVHRLVNSKYRDDDTTTEFLSGLSFNTNKLDIKGNNTTTSTSDANNTEDSDNKKPKKSILRNEKFNANVVASTSQSAPNLFSASSDKVNTALMKSIASHTESDASSRGKTSSENGFPKTSSEELYLKYLEALRREEAYKRHLKDKEMFLKQKLASSETTFKVPVPKDPKISNRLKDLMKDLTRNNYDDGSGDASKLEGASSSNMEFERFNAMRNQRSHSVFTLSSSHSECQKKPNLKKKMQAERDLDEAGPSKNHYCCCPHHYLNSKVGYTDSSVQVNIKYQCEDSPCNEKTSQTKPKPILPCESPKRKSESPRNTRVVPDNVTGDIKYVCLCNGKQVSSSEVCDNFMIYKCSKLTNRGVQLDDPGRIYNTGIQCGKCGSIKDDKIELIQPPCKMNTATDSSSSDNTSNARRSSKSSQANMPITCLGCSDNSYSAPEPINLCGTSTRCVLGSSSLKKSITIREATRCLQTEISINPQIADPTLSDINLVSECDCAKLVNEQTRKVSQPSSDKSECGKTFSDVCTNSTSEKLIIHSENNLCREVVKREGRKELQNTQSMPPANEYCVPIQGTNMTLTVNLGAVDISKKPEQVDQAVITDRVVHVDESTSVNGESGKSTQCSCASDRSNKSTKETSQPGSPKKPCITKPRLAESQTKCNTYPKKEPVKDKTPFQRCNTDNVLIVCSCVQTEPIKPKDLEKNNNEKNSAYSNVCNNQETEEPKDLEKNNNEKNIACSNVCNKQVEVKPKNFEKNNNDNNTSCSNVCNKQETEKPKDLEKANNEKNTACSNVCNKQVTEKTREISCQVTECDQTRETEKREREPTDSPSTNDNICTTKCGKKDTGTQKDLSDVEPKCPKRCTETETKNVACGTETEPKKDKETCIGCQTEEPKPCIPQKESQDKPNPPSACGQKCSPKPKEPCLPSKESPKQTCKVIDLIQDITRRYSKKEIVKIKNKKCFTEIMTVLNYLLETEDSTDQEHKTCCSSGSKSTSNDSNRIKIGKVNDCCSDKLVDKSVQLTCKKSCKFNKISTESSDLPTTSSDSAACKVLNKIKRECEKYHQKKCKSGRKCDVSSSTSVNCERCKKVHHCACRNHKCKRSKTFEKLQKKCIAYNLILQTSESMLSEETVCEKKCRPLKNIIVKVPKRKDCGKKDGCKMEHETPCCSRRCSPRCSKNRSKSCPNESETSDEYARRIELASVREYLEQNRPDFVEKSSQRQNCLKFIKRSKQHPAQRDLLSLHLEQQPDLTKLNSEELQQLARDIGIDLRKKHSAPKFISEREMKKHSENIYKTLPEVVQKKEEKRKESVKKTNLLMAELFKKNLQKQALRGAVNLSNYSTVIKI